MTECEKNPHGIFTWTLITLSLFLFSNHSFHPPPPLCITSPPSPLLLSLSGDRCSLEINECASNPCLSGGTCVDKLNEFQCLCPAGTHGLLCHSGVDHCAPRPCIHGECVEEQNGYLLQFSISITSVLMTCSVLDVCVLEIVCAILISHSMMCCTISVDICISLYSY